MELLSVIVGAIIALVGSLGVEALRGWQLRRADWRAMQVAALDELQELLCVIKDYVVLGKPVSEKAPTQAPSESDFEAFAPRTRARMLCSRLDEQDLAKRISTFLTDVKAPTAEWRHDSGAWLVVQGQFASFATELGTQLRTYKPRKL